MKNIVSKSINENLGSFEANIVSNCKKNPKFFYSYVNKKLIVKDQIKAIKDKEREINMDPNKNLRNIK